MSVSTHGYGLSGSQFGSSQKIDDFGKLTLGQSPGRLEPLDPLSDAFPMPSPLKGGPTESMGNLELSSKSQSVGRIPSAKRGDKARSSGSFHGLDPDLAHREMFLPDDAKLPRNSYSSPKRVHSPYVSNANPNVTVLRKPPYLDKVGDRLLPQDRRTHEAHPDEMTLDEQDMATKPYPKRRAIGDSDSPDRPRRAPDSSDTRHDIGMEVQPQMLLQPETRPISHAQLVVEVKGIYHGLVLVEQKCIEVDDKQRAATAEQDAAKKTELKDEQWQALIALHKTLLHEHHDFFLASQHPSASPALSKLASKYAMPARMWRHGIHSFLEVLRAHLPGSFDHMLAFVYIAYSMMALLYETVTAFEDTWIECLGDLARYRMVMEGGDSSDRDTWAGVARLWYNKAADRRPGVGRLYHHLAILSRPYSFLQLCYYTRSLTSVEPFDSARSSIMLHFRPVLDGKPSNYQVKAFEVAFIRLHGVLFDRPQDEETFHENMTSIQNGLLDGYIDRITSNFKAQGIYIATANVAALFEYGRHVRGKGRRSLVWQAFMAVKNTRDQDAAPNVPQSADEAFSLDGDGDSKPASPVSPLAEELSNTTTATTTEEQPSPSLGKASKLAFSSLSVALRRHGDQNVFPLVHYMLVFIWNLASIESVMKYFQADIPWNDICAFLNTLAKPDNMTKAVMNMDDSPQSGDKVERPLPEDFIMSGQLFVLDYLGTGSCKDEIVDEDERVLELPSMTATRVERMLWLGVRMAKVRLMSMCSRNFLTCVDE
ncbi:MAG: hypothetical protein Q9169_006221 [Polycauliona sp. 2 TL-2023]